MVNGLEEVRKRMSNIIDFIRMMIGQYTPITYEITKAVPLYNPTTGVIEVTSTTYETIPSGIAGVNFEYIAAALILAVCLYYTANALRFFINVSLGKKI